VNIKPFKKKSAKTPKAAASVSTVFAFMARYFRIRLKNSGSYRTEGAGNRWRDSALGSTRLRIFNSLLASFVA